MGRERRQPRCARCIKQRKQCDAAQPRCGLCTTMKKTCVYPAGMPSRREYLEMEARQQAQQRGEQGSDEMDVDEDNVMERADGRGRGQESPSFTQLQPLAPYASLRGGNREHLTSAYPSLYGSPSGVFTLSAGTIPVTGQQVHPYSQYTDSSHAEGQYMPQQSQTAQRGISSFDTNAGNHIARFYTPARQSLILDGPFSSDPPPIPDAAQDVLQIARSQVPATMNQTPDTEPRPPDLTPEQVGINLADALEANAPRHVGDVLDGLSDWTAHLNGLENVIGEEMKSARETMELIGALLFGQL
ncbi:hypothetical protein LTR70_005351 [Exophiala xenobiotica]|uniref:Zn(2)-C6 fungal-type domain-containing protein n=1 Tax=Lithohypha guttulata TaxID=1690604 RepID=A0ABR0K5C0_9EURO|nr:hypothetical protein LTR24_006681 [Lithohypha guttulata]KAK5318786.1 hypothetical protein LTR70_005351 [Exophiala xenobiotica]